MKKCFSAALTVLFLLIHFLQIGLAAEEPTVSPVPDSVVTLTASAPASIPESEKFNLVVTLASMAESAVNDGLYGIDFTLRYDTSLLAPVITSSAEGDQIITKVNNADTTHPWEVFYILHEGSISISVLTYVSKNAITDPSMLALAIPFQTLNTAEKTYLELENVYATVSVDRKPGTGAYTGITVRDNAPSYTDLSGIVYTLGADEKAMVTGAEKTDLTEISIAPSVTDNGTTYTVVGIAAEALSTLKGLKSIKIPCTVANIEKNAFRSGSELTVHGCLNSAAAIFASANGNLFLQDTAEYTTAESLKPTCTTTGWTVLQCPHCDEKTEKLLVAALGHHFGEWQVRTAATATKAGEEYRICSLCGTEETRTVGASACKHSSTVSEHKDATCTQVGYDRVRCELCGLYLRNTNLPALGHTPGPIKRQDATCTETGHIEQVCSVCGAELLNSVINAQGHIRGTVEKKEPTCTEAGYEKYCCAVCGVWYEQTNTPALEHSYGEWETILEATETNEGVRQHSCERCGHSETEIIPITAVSEASSEAESTEFSSEFVSEASENASDESTLSEENTLPEESFSGTSASVSKPSGEGMSEASEKNDNAVILYIIGIVVVVLCIGYILIMILNKRRNY